MGSSDHFRELVINLLLNFINMKFSSLLHYSIMR